MQQKTIIWILFLVLGGLWACQDPPVRASKFRSFPSVLKLSVDSNLVDTSFSPALHLPFQWIAQWPSDSTTAWLQAQNQNSLNQLLTNQNFKSYFAAQQIIGFPIEKNDHYYK